LRSLAECSALLTSLQALRVPAVFLTLKRAAPFFTKLLALCRDVSDARANREAWRTWFQLFRYTLATCIVSADPFLAHWL
jgi:hypothetical protein